MQRKFLVYSIRALGYIIITTSVVIFVGNFLEHFVILGLVAIVGCICARYKECTLPLSQTARILSIVYGITMLIGVIFRMFQLIQ